MTVTDVKFWSDQAKQHGIIAVLFTLILGFNGLFIWSVYREIPGHLQLIAAGYEKNADELNKSAEKFASSALAILASYKQDRLADRQAMIELIRAGDLDSRAVADAFEQATEKAGRQPDPIGTHIPNGSLQ